jgi:hypothetical protein
MHKNMVIKISGEQKRVSTFKCYSCYTAPMLLYSCIMI